MCRPVLFGNLKLSQIEFSHSFVRTLRTKLFLLLCLAVYVFKFLRDTNVGSGKELTKHSFFEVGLRSKWLTWTQPSCVHLYNLWLYVALYDYYCLLTVLRRHAWSTSKTGVCTNFANTWPVSVRMSWAKGMYHNCWFKAGWCRSSMENVWFETLPGYSASELWTLMHVLRKC
jgi:hypothetical protein